MVPRDTRTILGCLDKYFQDIYGISKGDRADADQGDKQLLEEFRVQEEERNKYVQPWQFPEDHIPPVPETEPRTYGEYKKRKADKLRNSTMCLGPMNAESLKRARTETQVGFATELMEGLGAGLNSRTTSQEQQQHNLHNPEGTRNIKTSVGFREQLRKYMKEQKNPK